MTRTTNARIAGVTDLLYIVVVIAGTLLFARTTGGSGVAAQLASVAAHAAEVRVAYLLGLSACFAAVILGVTLYAITREQDPDLAMLALICRVAEGVIGALFITMALARLWLATATDQDVPDPDATRALAAFLFKAAAWNPSTTFFAIGSTLFSWLLLRGRMVPPALAWLGVLGSGLLAVGHPLQLTGLLSGPVTWLMVLPVLVFEVWLAGWLLIKGVAPPRRA